MNAIRQSNNYIWSVLEAIGHGATGTVFACRFKSSGERFAAKVFNTQAEKRPYEVRMREIEVLKKLSHPNIVQLILLEQEHGSKATVLIMELCESSLHDLLEQPENIYGFEEEMFKDVIRDISLGMEYLKDCNIVHRDVKPGNILQAQKSNGEFVYKITDFGAARELYDTDQFVSVYGTEEYLHPDIYEKAVLKHSSSKTFTSKVDLWSLGVTIYHLATGQLPFRPIGGRKNKDVMFRMCTEKNHGDISCYQDDVTHRFIYESDLPDTTRLCHDLCILVTKLLRGLLEIDPQLMISYTSFFQSVKEIVNKRAIHMFFTKTCLFQKTYVCETDRLTNLHEYIGGGFKELYFEGRRFIPNEETLCFNFPPTTMQTALIVHGEFSAKEVKKKNYTIKTASSYDDLRLAKMYLSRAYALKRDAESSYSSVGSILNAQKAIGNTVSHYLEEQMQYAVNLKQRANDKSKTLQNYNDILRKNNKEHDGLASTTESDENCSTVLNLSTHVGAYISQNILPTVDIALWDIEKHLCCIEAHLKNMSQIFTKFLSDKYKRASPTLLDDLAHNADRGRIIAFYRSIHESIDQILDYQNNAQTQFGDWLSKVNETKEEVVKLKNSLDEEFCLLEKHFDKRTAEFKSKMLTYATSEPSIFTEIEKSLAGLHESFPELLKLATDQQQKLQTLPRLSNDFT